MPRPKTSPRVRPIGRTAATLGLLVLSVALVGCTRTPRSAFGTTGTLSTYSVSNGKFVTTVLLGRGSLIVAPPPDGSRAKLPESAARALFDSSDTASGTYSFAILGLGLVSLTVPSNANPTTTTSTTSSTVPPTSTAPAAGPTLPDYHRRLAWVGIAWTSAQPCTKSTTVAASSSGSSTELAMIMDANSGHDVLAFTDATASGCGGRAQTPTVVQPDELVSVAWQPVGPASTAVRVNIPACGDYYGWTQIAATTGAPDVQVIARVPYDALCGATNSQEIDVDDVVPLGSSQEQVPHAALGPVDYLRVLPGG